MVNINISIKKEAYEFLRTLKGRNKSFSEVILEFKGKKHNDGKALLRFAGVLQDVDWDAKKKE